MLPRVVLQTQFMGQGGEQIKGRDGRDRRRREGGGTGQKGERKGGKEVNRGRGGHGLVFSHTSECGEMRWPAPRLMTFRHGPRRGEARVRVSVFRSPAFLKEVFCVEKASRCRKRSWPRRKQGAGCRGFVSWRVFGLGCTRTVLHPMRDFAEPCNVVCSTYVTSRHATCTTLSALQPSLD